MRSNPLLYMLLIHHPQIILCVQREEYGLFQPPAQICLIFITGTVLPRTSCQDTSNQIIHLQIPRSSPLAHVERLLSPPLNESYPQPANESHSGNRIS
ncbi:hypothetical protein DL96DRAFT_806734 [Flagelloscypha sp. PMI_526]|nr:hypothetical protein DL96DRAFT_806734 [Flagelloscypha sp. PMI_526]